MGVRRYELFSMRQDAGEGAREFYVRVKECAETCGYVTKCGCTPPSEVHYTDCIIKDVFVAGISDDEIRRGILGWPDLDRSDMAGTIKFIENQEMVRNANTSNSASSFKMINMSREDTEPPLPPELWRAITNPYISINDSCSLALVSRSMWGRSREHKEWRNLKVNWKKLIKRGAHSLFDCPSFKMVKVLTLSRSQRASSDDRELINEVLECSLNCSTLEEIEFELSISEVSPELLARAVSELKGVTFRSEAKLTNKQLTILLEKSLQSDTLTDLNLDGIDLSEISAELLAKVCAILQNVNLRGTQLTAEQMTLILNTSSTSSTLKGLDFTYSDMSNVSLQLVSAAVPKLETVKMKKTSLTNVKLVDILIHSFSSATLKKLSLSSGCEVIILKLVNSNPRRYQLDLSEMGPYLPPSCITTILTKAVETSSLSKLDMTGINLSSIPAILIASLASQLHTLNLSNTKLTTEPSTIILKELLLSTKIKNINLSDITLTHVSDDLLVGVVGKLDEFTAEASGLTTEQSSRILQTSAVCFLSFNNLSEVNPEVIFKNYRKNIWLEDRKMMTNTCLTSKQVKVIFQKYCESDDEFPIFTMSYQNLSQVSVDLLSKFVSKFTEVSLNNCNITEVQVSGIRQKLLPSTKVNYQYKTLSINRE